MKWYAVEKTLLFYYYHFVGHCSSFYLPCRVFTRMFKLAGGTVSFSNRGVGKIYIPLSNEPKEQSIAEPQIHTTVDEEEYTGSYKLVEQGTKHASTKLADSDE